MKRKFLIVLLALTLAIVSAFTLAACDELSFPIGGAGGSDRDNGSTVVTPGGDTDNKGNDDTEMPEPEKPDTHGFKFNLLDDDTYEVIGYDGTLAKIDIPSEYDGKTVTVIGDEAFRYCKKLMDVTMGNNITSIGDGAFYNCSGLKYITIPESVTNIGKDTFYNCPIEAAIIPAFACSSVKNGALRRVIITGGDSIGNNTFYNCTSLTSVTIGTGITGIGDGAFGNCYRLAEVYNLSSLNITKGANDNGCIGYYAFDIYTDNDASSKLIEEDDFVIHTDGNVRTLVGYYGDKTEIAIPGGITSIGRYAFAYSGSITSITMPDSVTDIGNYAFAYSGRLMNIKIGECVADIGERAFAYCASLTSIIIPDSVVNVGNYAFCVCRSIKTIIIPSGVTDIGSNVFWDCSNLETIYCKVASQPSGWHSDWKDGCSANVVWG